MGMMEVRRGLMAMAGGSGATINGRRFTCGTKTLSDANTLSFTIEHGLGVTPEAVFVWLVDAPKKINDVNIQSANGGMLYSGNSKGNSVVMRTANGTYTSAVAGTYGISKDDTYITCQSYSTYYWLTGYTYQWLAIAPEGA